MQRHQINTGDQCIATVYHPEILAKTKQDYFDAIRRSDGVTIQNLVQKEPDLIRACDEEGNSGLHLSVIYQNIELTQLLLQYKSSLNSQNNFSLTPIQLAFHHHALDYVKTLCQLNVNCRYAVLKELKILDIYIYGYAVLNEDCELLNLCLNPVVDANQEFSFKEDGTGLHFAIGRGKLAIVKELLARGARVDIPNKAGLTAIQCAFLYGNWNAIQLIDQSPKHPFALLKAMTSDNTANALILLSGNMVAIDDLFRKEINPNIECDVHSNTVLHYAVKNENVHLIQFLLDQGARLDCVNDHNQTALELGCQLKLVKSVRVLVERDKDNNLYQAQYQNLIEKAWDEVEFNMVHAFLDTQAFGIFLSTDKGKEYFKFLIATEQREVIDSLRHAKRQLIVDLTEKYLIECCLPEKMEALLEDSILHTLITDPYITPQGITYEYGGISQWVAAHETDPLTREKLTIASLIPNLLIKDVLIFYRSHPEATAIPPCLVRPETKELYKNPVVARDGKTYERAELVLHLQKTNGVLPSGVEQFVGTLYPNRLAKSLIEFFQKKVISSEIRPIGVAHSPDALFADQHKEEAKVEFAKPYKKKDLINGIS